VTLVEIDKLMPHSRSFPDGKLLLILNKNTMQTRGYNYFLYTKKNFWLKMNDTEDSDHFNWYSGYLN